VTVQDVPLPLWVYLHVNVRYLDIVTTSDTLVSPTPPPIYNILHQEVEREAR